MGVPAKKKQQQGERSRESILDATERLMATKGYAATSISDIRDACGLAPSSIYWHFGSKEGVLAAMMERGAQRFFAAIPTWDEAHGPVEQRSERQLTELVSLQSQHPDFLRLFLPAVDGTKSGSGGCRGGAPGPQHRDRPIS